MSELLFSWRGNFCYSPSAHYQVCWTFLRSSWCWAMPEKMNSLACHITNASSSLEWVTEQGYQGNWLLCMAVLHTWITNLMECVFMFSHTALPQHNSPLGVPAVWDRWRVAQISWFPKNGTTASVVNVLPAKQLPLSPVNELELPGILCSWWNWTSSACMTIFLVADCYCIWLLGFVA